ncbi:MAG: M48 family metalloprotease [Candidatus Aenigmarchaeota archaeon]|nr:M48 family metalloprotease [Candidatus Aenigmarchaeota archaeon]
MPRLKYPYEFDPEKRRIAKTYRRGRLLIFLFSILLSTSLILFILSTGYHITLKQLVAQYPSQTIFYALTFLFIITIFKFPLTFYSSYIYEHKFKLSRYSILSWLKDFVKMTLLGYVISLILIYFLYTTIRTFSAWWLFAGMLYAIFMTVMNYIYPLVILPFMWKVEPYKDSRMKQKILKLCRRLGVTSIKNIVVIKESEKSVRPNAVFMGFGNSRKIGLYDTLLGSFTKDETETVVGHELGHYVNRDVWKGFAIEAILIFPMLFAVDYVVDVSGPAFGIYSIADISSLPLIVLTFGILDFLLAPIVNAYSRHREAMADEFALEHVRKPFAQVSTEKRLADMGLSDSKPHWLVEFWLFNHPATFRRIKMAERWRKKLKNS